MTDKKYRVFFLILLLITIAGVIFYKFPFLPRGLTLDEVENANIAKFLESSPYIPYTDKATGHPTLYRYLLVLFFNIFEVNTFALRLPSALFGVLATVVFYFIMKYVFKKNDFWPFAAAFLFVTTRWYFNFTRFAFEVTFLLFFELISLLFIFYYGEKQKNIFLILSGVFAGLAYNSYIPGRVFVFVPLFFLIAKIIKEKLNWKAFLYYFVPFLILITPLTLYLNQHEDVRVKQQLYFANERLTFPEKLSYLGENMLSTAKMFHIEGDVNGRHNYPLKPALNLIIGILFPIGLILAIRSWKNLTNQVFILYFGISLFPTLLTLPWENPNMLRTCTVIPSIIYFSVLSLKFIKEKVIQYFQSVPVIYVYLFIMMLVMLSALYDLRTYHKYHSMIFYQTFPIMMPLEQAIITDIDELRF